MNQSAGTALVVMREYGDQNGTSFFVPKDTVPPIAHLYGVYSKRGRIHEKRMDHARSAKERASARRALKKLNAETCNIMRGCFPQFQSASDEQIRWITWDIFEDQAWNDAAVHWQKNAKSITSGLKQFFSAVQ